MFSATTTYRSLNVAVKIYVYILRTSILKINCSLYTTLNLYFCCLLPITHYRNICIQPNKLFSRCLKIRLIVVNTDRSNLEYCKFTLTSLWFSGILSILTITITRNFYTSSKRLTTPIPNIYQNNYQRYNYYYCNTYTSHYSNIIAFYNHLYIT